MTIKVYILEFDHFDKVCWKRCSVKITALSKIQLMRCYISEYFHSKADKIEYKRIWKQNRIDEDTLTFPLIETKEH